jgi:hypothetical protein
MATARSCCSCVSSITRDQQEEQHEDNQEHDGPSSESAKVSVHPLLPPSAPATWNKAQDVMLAYCSSRRLVSRSVVAIRAAWINNHISRNRLIVMSRHVDDDVSVDIHNGMNNRYLTRDVAIPYDILWITHDWWAMMGRRRCMVVTGIVRCLDLLHLDLRDTMRNVSVVWRRR